MAENQANKSPKERHEPPQPQAPATPRKPRRQPIITDPLVPHTINAQSMARYSGPVPSYVDVMDRYAHRAGLNARRLARRLSTRYGNELLLVYSGTREQIQQCELVADPKELRWPSTPKAGIFTSVRLTPWAHEQRGNLHRLTPPLYALTLRVDLPQSVSMPCKGVECFDFYQHGVLGKRAYLGSREALIGGGIADGDMFPEDGTEMEITRKDRNSYAFTLEESVLLHGGRWAYLKYPEAAKRIEADERAEEERNKGSEPASAEDFRDKRIGTTKMFLYHLHCALGYRRTAAETPYSYNEETLTEIHGLMAEILELVKERPIVSLRPIVNHTRLQEVKAAETDPAFQRFMSQLPKSSAK